jgi:NAD(P)-dependent dehydrogenase (short-subunit alcohol dehydrogenase family)
MKQDIQLRQPLRDLKVAISGGTSGLGLALLRQFAAAGASVAFVARDAARVARIVGSLPGTHGFPGDVAKKSDIYPLATAIAGALGGLDLLINNASDLGPVPLALLADTDCEDLERAMATNVVGPFRLTKALLGALAASAREGRGGVVVNISSDAAVTPYPGWGAYGASKAALHHLSQIWNLELVEAGIHILSHDPGDMDTPLHAVAVPEADPALLKSPEDSARELIAAIEAALPHPTIASDS